MMRYIRRTLSDKFLNVYKTCNGLAMVGGKDVLIGHSMTVTTRTVQKILNTNGPATSTRIALRP